MNRDQKASLRSRFVNAVYATHNSSPAIKSAVTRCLARLNGQDTGLNVGAGSTRLHPKVLNLDLAPGPNIDCCASVEAIPFPDARFSLVLSQETLEHVRDPFRAVNEVYRVLKAGGTFYCQVPFIIGYHPGPTDFWRFSREGIRELVERAGFICEEIGVAVGPATGFYRILVEFFAVAASRAWKPLYIPIKGAAALFFYPVKWLDMLLLKSTQVDRIPGGYYVIARKK